MLEYIKDERMYQAGVLRIAMKMRMGSWRSFEDILADTITELRLDPDGFRKYVNAHMQSVMSSSKQTRNRS